MTARGYAARFGLGETSRHVARRLREDVRLAVEPWRARLRGVEGLAPHLPGHDPRWARDACAAMRTAAQAAGGRLDPEVLEAAVRELARQVDGRPLRDEVTVVIAGYEQTAWLLACVRSIVTDPCGGIPPIVLVDDASPSADLTVFAILPSVTVLRNEVNEGYVHTVNHGAAAVTTRLLVTVNQDVIVAPGWLDALTAALDADPSVGVTGPRVLDPRLRVAEAGGLVFRDGSAAHRGRGSRADDPEIAWALDVDYVSGCVLATRTELWRELSGLDERFAPAYYDDVDLCLRVQEAGLRVRYVPGSVVLHAEGTSMGRDPDDESSLKHLQVRHREVLLARHHAALQERGDRPIDPARAMPPRRRHECVLALGSAPERARDGGSVEVWALIGYLQQLGWDITAVLDERPSADALAQLHFAGVRVLTADRTGLLGSVPSPQLLVSYGFAGGRLASTVRGAWTSVPPHVHLTCDVAARRLESILSAGMERDAAIARWYPGVAATLEGTWQAELSFLSVADVTVFVTPEDLAFARERGFAGAARVSPVMRSQAAEPVRDPVTDPVVGFVGSMQHGPNVDAVRWFLSDCWPSIREAVPRARFEVHGSGLSERLRREIESVAGVKAMGAYDEGVNIYERLRVAVAPIRVGAGLNTKVLDAILHATPVVGTVRAFEGLSTELGVRCVGPEDLVVDAVRLLVDDEAWTALAGANHVVGVRDHSAEAERARLAGILTSVDEEARW